MVAQPGAPLREKGDLVGHGYGRRVDVERAGPAHVAVGRLGRQLDTSAARPARQPRHLHGLLGEARRLFRAHVDGGGEPDCSVDHDAQAHAELGVVRRGLGMRVVETDRLAPDALDAELGRLAGLRRTECGVGERRELVGVERHQATGVGWRIGSPAAV